MFFSIDLEKAALSDLRKRSRDRCRRNLLRSCGGGSAISLISDEALEPKPAGVGAGVSSDGTCLVSPQVRSTISDFAVFITIMIMVVVDYLMGIPSPKLNVPDRFEVSTDVRLSCG